MRQKTPPLHKPPSINPAIPLWKLTTGQRIRVAREALGLTQAELGKKIGVKISCVSMMECRKGDHLVSKLRRVALALGVRLAWLVSGEGEQHAA